MEEKNITPDVNVKADTQKDILTEEKSINEQAMETAKQIRAEKMAKKEKRHKKLFWLRMPIFIAAMLIILTYFIYVLTPKHAYGICSILNYYRQEKGTVDVLAVGTSLTYTNLNTNILWDEYGIACYDLATAEQPYWSTYAYLCEAFRVQKPKLVLLDLKAMTYLDDRVDRTRTVLCTFGILNPVTRLKAIYECVEPEEFLGYALAFPQIHTNYVNNKKTDWILPPTNGNRGGNWKGFIEKNETAEHETPSINFAFKTPKYVNEHESGFFEKILQLCIENDVPVMLIGYPNADYKHDHLYYCAGFEIAEKYGITGINYNLPENAVGINYATECADWQHLNILGSSKLTRAVGRDLKELFDLEDHRGDPAYESWDKEAERWFKLYPQYRKKTE